MDIKGEKGVKIIKYNACIRCRSENVDKLLVNSMLGLNYPEENLFDIENGNPSEYIQGNVIDE